MRRGAGRARTPPRLHARGRVAGFHDTPRTHHRFGAIQSASPKSPIASTVDLAKSVLGIWLFISAAVLAPHKTSSSYLHGAMFDGMLVGGLLIVGRDLRRRSR